MFDVIHQRARHVAAQMEKKNALNLVKVMVRTMNGGRSRNGKPLPSSGIIAPMLPFLEAWIEAGYDLDKWALRERFESVIWASRRCLVQVEGRPIRVIAEVTANLIADVLAGM